MNNENSHTIEMTPIGYVVSPYKEKFAIPRQPGLVKAAKGEITLTGLANNEEIVRGLADYSHIWILFIFHKTQDQGWQTLVRPPRLGGNKKMGTLATRSTFRPNPIGMSVVKLDSVEISNQQVKLHISGLDLIDKTPVLDIKPYIAYADSIEDAHSGIAQDAPAQEVTIKFTSEVLSFIDSVTNDFPSLKNLITQVLAQDPRPAYRKSKADNKRYGMELYSFNIEWQMESLTHANVIGISHSQKS